MLEPRHLNLGNRLYAVIEGGCRYQLEQGMNESPGKLSCSATLIGATTLQFFRSVRCDLSTLTQREGFETSFAILSVERSARLFVLCLLPRLAQASKQRLNFSGIYAVTEVTDLDSSDPIHVVELNENLDFVRFGIETVPDHF